ncbi:hypothetical protein DOK78_001707 [Enterococcus sp. DIV2402]|uniref:Nudix hydrolase domain-containing protein n=1 Tax=Candidatus Enterococcus lowellii TaxID=2230877 RepID=A0ABZ2SMM4_9ENTE|nr:NUDIX domain-containing protein [Enterococcus sp. DIV2402]MBO0464107.1 NUDIX domain-containing protein [Enterococcus sp. DIV2402]
MNDLTLEMPEGKLTIRVAAWIEQENQLLVATYPDGTISLPGGRLKFSETTLAGIYRELFEETGEQLIDAQLWAIIENFFQQEKQQYHEFLYIYRGTIPTKENYASESEEEFISWISKDDISALKPSCLQKLVSANPSSLIHLVNID